MQLHGQLPELREGGARRGEDLSDLGGGAALRGAGAQCRTGPPGAPSPTPGWTPARPSPGMEEPGANLGAPPSRGRQGALSAREVEPL